ncbi:lytic polysaccharide monooxygenase [Streptomyces sp. NPDC001985]|uniref:lytic polysaccharide monooxygenase auxiliary activity family 9 protein n=1 Tax=Streptomyces sp. NPDC001985 TaxID=3154406 RepID=UPI00331E91FB
MIDPRTATALALRCAAVMAVPVLLAAAAPWTAYAHGAPVDPVSRTAACTTEGPERDSAACRAAVAANGGAPLGAWNGLKVSGVQGRERELIPDGQLCSAGLDGYRGLDAVRTDWPSAELVAGEPFTLRYRGSVPHEGTFELYLTREGYDPGQPLRWSDLAAEPFAEVLNPPAENGEYRIDATVPAGLTGPHVLYTVWRTSDSPDTYFACSDVLLTGQAPESGSFGLYGKQSPVSVLDTPSAAPATEPSARAEGEEESEEGVSLAVVAGGAGVLAVLVLGALATLRPPQQQEHRHRR